MRLENLAHGIRQTVSAVFAGLFEVAIYDFKAGDAVLRSQSVISSLPGGRRQ